MFREIFVIEIDRPGRISLFLRVAADAGIHISRRRLFRSGTRKRNSQVTAEFPVHRIGRRLIVISRERNLIIGISRFFAQHLGQIEQPAQRGASTTVCPLASTYQLCTRCSSPSRAPARKVRRRPRSDNDQTASRPYPRSARTERPDRSGAKHRIRKRTKSENRYPSGPY